MDYKAICDRVRLNGEPGFAWLENMKVWKVTHFVLSPCSGRSCADEPLSVLLMMIMPQAYGRMCSPPDFRDKRSGGGNPCLEQTLESFELCCLVSPAPCQAERVVKRGKTD